MPVEIRLIGESINGSQTPRLHEAEAKAHSLELNYARIDTSDPEIRKIPLEDLLTELENTGVQGVNITYPFKRDIMRYLDQIDPEAKNVGAVNTVRFEKGKRLGFNTDIYGFSQMMRKGLGNVVPERPLLIGAGGAGGAIVYALAQLGVKNLVISDRDLNQAEGLSNAMQSTNINIEVVANHKLPEALQNVSGVINATPMGMDKYPGTVVDPSYLTPRHFVADIVYFPLETELLRKARLQGCRVISGAVMAVAQAAQAFEIFTRIKANEARMFNNFSYIQSQTEAAQ